MHFFNFSSGYTIRQKETDKLSKKKKVYQHDSKEDDPTQATSNLEAESPSKENDKNSNPTDLQECDSDIDSDNDDGYESFDEMDYHTNIKKLQEYNKFL